MMMICVSLRCDVFLSMQRLVTFLFCLLNFLCFGCYCHCSLVWSWRMGIQSDGGGDDVMKNDGDRDALIQSMSCWYLKETCSWKNLQVELLFCF